MRKPLLQALIIVALGIGAGLVHRQLRPFTLELKPAVPTVPTPGATTPAGPITPPTPADPAKPVTPVTLAPTAPTPITPAPISTAPVDGIYITTEQAKAIFDAQSAEWIDARNPDEFAAGAIPGAFNVPPVAFAGGQIPDVINILSPAKQVVVYCGGGECDASNLVALRLQGSGFTNVVVYKDGYAGWSTNKFPSTAPAGTAPAGGGK